MKIAARIIALSTLLACSSAYAMEEATWDFHGHVLEGIEPQHLTTVEIAAQGMYVNTQTDGVLKMPVPTVRADALVITLTNIASPRIALLWQNEGMRQGEYYQENVDLPTGATQRVIVDVDAIPEWNGSPTGVGIAFPANTEVLVESIEWREYSAAEKLSNAFISFWTPDTFKMYSINFLWGPLISTSPEAREVMYDGLPPKAWSATRVLYALFAIAVIVALIARFTDSVRGPTRMKTILLVAGAALWILFDVRMTQEIVSYAARDWSTYVLVRGDDRTLRSHSTLYDVLDRLDSLLEDDDRYVLVTNEGTPFFSNVRYKLYPALPESPTPNATARSWIVLGVRGVAVKDGSIVLPNGTALSPKGTVIEQFDDGSFFFRVQ